MIEKYMDLAMVNIARAEGARTDGLIDRATLDTQISIAYSLAALTLILQKGGNPTLTVTGSLGSAEVPNGE